LDLVDVGSEWRKRTFATKFVKPLDKRQQDLVSTVAQRRCTNLRLSDSLLNPARNETGCQITVGNITFDLGELVTSVKDKFLVQAERKNIVTSITRGAAFRVAGRSIKLAWAEGKIRGQVALAKEIVRLVVVESLPRL
jgi:hypothetical protein